MLETVITSAVIAAAISFLAKTWIAERLAQSIRHEYDTKLATFQNELKAQADVALERLRSELQIAAEKRNIEYSRIHEKRLEVISRLVGKLLNFHQKVSAYVTPMESEGCPPKEERRKLAAAAFSEFNDYFNPNRLFLPESTVSKVEAFREGLYAISMEFMFYVEQKPLDRSEPARDIKVWGKACTYTSEQAPKIIRELEGDFRRILGIDPVCP